ncbi:ABC transporter permease [Promethearchaeum syntrophicum]|uniref:ABC transporter permease n=1 Tax=Promethearchaeum syntrophicum TaxID=2594042 RepID=A0A5B9DCN1_9ARCH|nr:ABC transporter permease [Candidatus Prometheoarchaeum syntrophicum]QEE16765.1 FtsX-like permease family protein [Candidatus Prometheoarchaeum syntrophicum]
MENKPEKNISKKNKQGLNKRENNSSIHKINQRRVFPKKKKLEFIATFPFETIPQTFKSVIHNKRRSFAMLAGIILATSLLSGIIIYNKELKENNYLTLIEDQPFEVGFNIPNNESMIALNELATQIRSNEKVLAASIFGGRRGDFKGYLETKLFTSTDLVSEDPEGVVAFPLFMEESIFSNEIGEKIAEMDFEGELDLSGDSAIIPSRMARDLDLEIGQKIPLINLTQIYYDDGDPPNPVQINGQLTNITIKGTYKLAEQTSFSITDIFSSSPFQGWNIYLSMDLLTNKTSMDALETIMHDQGNFYIGVKLDINQFSVGDPETFIEEINIFINDIARNNNNDLEGSIIIQDAVIGFEIISIFITILYVALSIPVIILSIYLLNFGIEMSLEERRRGIAIRKVQGANSRQIFGELRSETIFLLLVGTVIGYLAGIVSAWLITSATGYMIIAPDPTTFIDFVYLDWTALLVPFVFTSLLIILQIYKKGRKFINSEVTQGVVRRDQKKISFLKRTYLDFVFFIIGVIGLGIVVAQRLKVDIQLSLLAQLGIFLITPFLFWIGGSSLGSRLTKWVPLKLQASFLRLKVLNDVKRIIKSGLKRRGDVDRLALIIILTLSIAVLATIQGTTEERHAERDLEWQVGADWQVNFNTPADHHANLSQIIGFDENIALTGTFVKILTSSLSVIAIENSFELANLQEGKPVLYWQEDNFNSFTAQEALQELETTPRGIFLTSDYADYLALNTEDKIDIKVPITGSTSGEFHEIEDISILGTMNQFPGSLSFSSLTSESLMREILALSMNMSADALATGALNSSRYYVRTDNGADMSVDQISATQIEVEEMDDIENDRSFYYEKNRLDSSTQGYGISGLLSMDFVISLLASLISAFAFSAIIMEKRKHEFAILRSIGAKKKHIYKLALGENTLMMLTASIWGIFLGIGIAQLFNGVFMFVSMISETFSSIDRLVEIPIVELIIISTVTFLGMLGATVASIRSAANQDIAVGIKEV